jgi:hypothetical protein
MNQLVGASKPALLQRKDAQANHEAQRSCDKGFRHDAESHPKDDQEEEAQHKRGAGGSSARITAEVILHLGR